MPNSTNFKKSLKKLKPILKTIRRLGKSYWNFLDNFFKNNKWVKQKANCIVQEGIIKDYVKAINFVTFWCNFSVTLLILLAINLILTGSIATHLVSLFFLPFLAFVIDLIKPTWRILTGKESIAKSPRVYEIVTATSSLVVLMAILNWGAWQERPALVYETDATRGGGYQSENVVVAESMLSGKIARIKDGDTAEVEYQDRTETVRFACIDAPESSQVPWGGQSSQHLEKLAPVGQEVQLRVVDVDGNGRTVAEVYRRNQSVNLQMVRDGQAVVYRQYLDKCNDTRNAYLKAESKAQRQKRGYWNQISPCMPWDYRRKLCTG